MQIQHRNTLLQLQVSNLISVLVRNLLEFKRPVIDAFSHSAEVIMLVPIATNILFYDLEKPRTFGSPNQNLRDTGTGFLNCLCPRKTRTNKIRT
jgi:hypothetical protein